MHRLFVAIRPPRSLRTALLGLAADAEGARWQDDGQLHVTLRYVGEVERPLAEDIAVALASVRARSFDLELGQPGRFDRRGRLDSLWIGAAPADILSSLHRKVDRLIAGLGLPPEGRAYLPHITLARFGRASGDPGGFFSAAAAVAGRTAPISEFGLFESHLGRHGAFYERVARYPLQASG